MKGTVSASASLSEFPGLLPPRTGDLVLPGLIAFCSPSIWIEADTFCLGCGGKDASACTELSVLLAIEVPPFCRLVRFIKSLRVKFKSLKACSRNTPKTMVRNPHNEPITSTVVSLSHSLNKMAEADGECCKHDIVYWSNNRSVEYIQRLV